ncbi:hypothetical protein ACFX13_002980 [Malus domestica]
MALVSAMAWSPYLSTRASTPCASLTFLIGSTTRKSFVSLSGGAAARSPFLHCSFISSSSIASTSAFSCLSLGLDLSSSVRIGRRRGSGLVVRAGKVALCLTKRSKSRKSLARTHGFYRRMRTTGGKAMMKHRYAKGLKVLYTKSNPSSGKQPAPPIQ